MEVIKFNLSKNGTLQIIVDDFSDIKSVVIQDKNGYGTVFVKDDDVLNRIATRKIKAR